MEEKMVKVAKANQGGEYSINIEDVKNWKIKSKTTFGGTIYVTTEENETFSMLKSDYEDINGKY